MEIPSDFEYQGEIYSPLPNKFPSFQELDQYTSFSVKPFFVVSFKISYLAIWSSYQLGKLFWISKLFIGLKSRRFQRR